MSTAGEATERAEEVRGDRVALVPVPAQAVDAVLGGDLGGRPAGPGWPHDDTAPGLSFARAGGWTWLVVAETGEVVGECGVKGPPGPDGVVEIGYGLAAPSRGHGLGTRAIRALVDWLADRPDVHAIEAETDPGNLPSRRLLERLGFTIIEHDASYVRYRREASPR